MSRAARRWINWAALGLGMGLLAGLAAGWWLWPMRHANTAPSALHVTYQDEYVLMTAAAFEVEEDPAQAEERLRAIAPEAPALPVIRLAEQLIKTGGDPEEIARLARLAQALGSVPSTLVPYLAGIHE